MYKILLVEDNPVNRTMIHRRLSMDPNFLIGEAQDGLEAVEIAYHFQPDLILMDLGTPVMDGWTATSQLRTYSQTVNIPIIALTAHASKEDRQRALDAGCDAFVEKPINFTLLKGEMDRLLAKGRGAEARSL